MKLTEIYDPLVEAGLSRILSQVNKYQIATITAFRGKNENCIKSTNDSPDGSTYTKQQNIARNRKLKAKLLSYGYGVTEIDGAYIENFNPESKDARREVKEDSFFVVNLNNDPDFKSKIIDLGKLFCQDSVLIKEDDGYYLVGTNNSDWPGIGNKQKVGSRFVAGIEREFMSKIRNRPFSFESKLPKLSDLIENITFYNINAIRLIKKEANEANCCK